MTEATYDLQANLPDRRVHRWDELAARTHHLRLAELELRCDDVEHVQLAVLGHNLSLVVYQQMCVVDLGGVIRDSFVNSAERKPHVAVFGQLSVLTNGFAGEWFRKFERFLP